MARERQIANPARRTMHALRRDDGLLPQVLLDDRRCARALIGKYAGDAVAVHTPGGISSSGAA